MIKVIVICFIVVVLTAACWINTSEQSLLNSPPYPVHVFEDSYHYSEDSGVRTIQLHIEMQDGLKDPEDDTVFFRSSSLPSWISLNNNTGLLSVLTEESHESKNYIFWSEDEHGADTSDEPCTIEISVD